MSSIGSDSSEVLSLVAGLASFDQTGVFMKFTQMSKLFARYRVINLRFGTLLDLHFKENAKRLDKRTKHNDNYIELNSKFHRAKFSKEYTPLHPFENIVALIKIVLYFLSFVAMIASNTFL